MNNEKTDNSKESSEMQEENENEDDEVEKNEKEGNNETNNYNQNKSFVFRSEAARSEWFQTSQKCSENEIIHYRCIKKMLLSHSDSGKSGDESSSEDELNERGFEREKNMNSKHLSSVPSFQDSNGKVMSLSLNEEALDECKDITELLHNTVLKDTSCKSSSSSDYDFEKFRQSPDVANVSDCDSPEEDKQPYCIVKGTNSFFSKTSDFIKTLKFKCEGKENPPISHKWDSLRYPKAIRQLIDIESSPEKSLELCSNNTFFPTNSNCTALKSCDSSSKPNFCNVAEKDERKQNLPLVIDKSPDKYLPSKVENFISQDSEICRKMFSHSWEKPSTSKYFDEWQNSNMLTSLDNSNNTENVNSNSEIFEKKLTRSWESTSSREFSKNKCSGQLWEGFYKFNVDDSETSSDDAERKLPRKKLNKKKRNMFSFDKSDSTKKRLTRPRSLENVSDDAHIPQKKIQKNSEEKSESLKKNMSPKNASYSSTIINSESRKLSRKRHVSNPESGDEKREQIKRLKSNEQ